MDENLKESITITPMRGENNKRSKKEGSEEERGGKMFANFCIYSLAAASLLILIIQLETIQICEAKKLIKLKDLKKAKKYGYLLATQRKKFYAIPVPFPLPVVVKRQQIYTQVPIVPRYVQQQAQQQYSQPATSSHYAAYDPYDSYAAMSVPQYMSSSGDYHQPHFRYPRVRYAGGGGGGLGVGGLGGGRYLASLASALGQAYPGGLPSQGVAGNVVGKLLSGQAKVLPPSQIRSLLFSSPKPPAGYKPSESSEAGEPEVGAKQPAKTAESSTSGNGTTTTSAADKPSASESVYSTLQSPFEPASSYHQDRRRPLYRPTPFYPIPAAAAYPFPAGYPPGATRLLPAGLVAGPAPLQQLAMAEMLRQQLELTQAAAAAAISSGNPGTEALSAEPSELGAQMELMQPQESMESSQIAVSSETEGKMREQAFRRALIRAQRIRLAEAKSLLAARQLGLLPAGTAAS